MDQSELVAFEHYILTRSRELFASTSVWGCYLECLDILRQDNVDFEDLKLKIQWIKQTDVNLAKTISLRKALKQYDMGQDKIFEKLDKIFFLTQHSKPDVRYENEQQADESSSQVDISKYFEFKDNIKDQYQKLSIVGQYQINFQDVPQRVFWEMVSNSSQDEYRVKGFRDRLFSEVIQNSEKIDSINLDAITADEMQFLYENSQQIQRNYRFVNTWMQKLFSKDIKKAKDNNSKLAILNQVLQFAQRLPEQFQDFRLGLQKQILVLQFKLGMLKQDEFIQGLDTLTYYDELETGLRPQGSLGRPDQPLGMLIQQQDMLRNNYYQPQQPLAANFIQPSYQDLNQVEQRNIQFLPEEGLPPQLLMHLQQTQQNMLGKNYYGNQQVLGNQEFLNRVQNFQQPDYQIEAQQNQMMYGMNQDFGNQNMDYQFQVDDDVNVESIYTEEQKFDMDQNSDLEQVLMSQNSYGSSQIMPNVQRTQHKNEPVKKFKPIRNFPKEFQIVKNQDKWIKRAVNRFAQQNQTIEPFNLYYPPNVLKRDFVRKQILSGMPVTSLKYETNKKFIDNIMKQVEIEPKKKNPKFFDREDSVQVALKIKNVKDLMIRIYQINALTYYKQMKKQLSTDISLIGIQPQFEYNYTYTVQPNLRHIETFTFDDLASLQGVFVIDFLGSGRHTRTMINKGQVRHLQFTTVQGQKICVLNENNQICNNPGAGVIFDGEFYQPQEDGFVLLPFSRSSGLKQLIITDGQVSSLIDSFDLLQENYELTATVAINHESIVFGNRANIVIYPKLYMSSVKADLGQLRNFTVDLKLVDQIGNTESKQFKVEDISDEIKLQIDVPNQLQYIETSISAKIKYLSRQKLQTVSFQHQYQCNVITSTLSNFYLIYNSSGDSYLKLIGKSGEVWANKEVRVMIQTVFQENEIMQQLKTNSQGLINLGDINYISQFNVLFDQGQGYQRWATDLYKEQQTLPHTLDLCVGDQYKLPAFGHQLLPQEKRAFLFKILGNENNWKLHSDVTSALVVDEEQNYVLNSLAKGKYILYFPGMNQNVLIHVHDGVHWGDNRFILSAQKSIPTPDQYNTFRIKQINNEGNRVHIQLSGNYQEAKVLILGFHYLADSQYKIYQNMQEQTKREIWDSEKLYQAPSLYLKSKAIDEEYQYVLQRRNIKNMLGNSLPKPQLILNRHFLRDTASQTRGADKGEALEAKQMARRAGAHHKQPAKPQNSMIAHLDQNERSENFLVYPGFIIDNLKVDFNGELSLEIPDLEEFNAIQVIAFNQNDQAMKVHSLGMKDTKTRSMALKESLDTSKTYSTTRNFKVLEYNQKFEIEDLTGIKTKVIDSIQSLFDNLLNLFPNYSSQFQQFRFLCNWASLTQENKLIQYSKSSSHELNLFLYFKDRSFFNQHIAQFLQNKMRKDFIDRWLLGEDLSEYCNSGSLSKLNILEKLLLVQRYYIEKPELCQGIRRVLSWQLSANGDQGQKAFYNRMFDAVLNSNKIENPDLASFDRNNFRDMYCNAMPTKAFKMNFSNAPQFNIQSVKRRQLSTSNRIVEPDELSMSYRIEDAQQKPGRGLKSKPQQKQYFEQTGSTKEYTETYWSNQTSQDTYISISYFWIELIDAALQGQFQILSTSFMKDQQANFISLMAVLTFSNLPFAPVAPSIESKGSGLEYTAQTTLLILYKTQGVVPYNQSQEVVLAQKCFDVNDSSCKNITNFLTRTLYKCQVSIVNLSNESKNISVMFQVPQGAVPIAPASSLMESSFSLHPNNSQTIDATFYFPKAGDFIQYPPTASFEGEVIAKGDPREYKVVDFYDQDYFQTFRDVAASGNISNIINYLNERMDVEPIEIYSCFWLLENKEFYDKLVEFYKQNGHYDITIWNYSYKHKDVETLKEFFNANDYSYLFGPYLDTQLVKTGSGNIAQMEYDPLVNPRVHKLANHIGITNTAFSDVYINFIKNLSQKPELDDCDRMQWVQYLLYQDRQNEALSLFKQIQLTPSQGERKVGYLQMQYDYLACYFDLQNAVAIAQLYVDYPISTWANKFKKVIEILSQKQQELKITQEPTLQVSINNKKIALSYSNVSQVNIKYHIIDLELIFSRFPFTNQGMDGLGWVQPSLELSYQIDDQLHSQLIEIPEELQDKSMMIEVDYVKRSTSTIYFSSKLKTYIDEKYGEIVVYHQDGYPLGGAYVKVFSQYRDGRTDYYKDGYTDSVGRFFYATLNTNILGQISKFAMLVSHHEYGAVKLEVNPPPQ